MQKLMLSLCHLLLCCLTAAIANEMPPVPGCMRSAFTQRGLLQGALERRPGNDGKLTFPSNAAVEMVSVYLRVHPRRVPHSDPFDVPSASTLSFAYTLDNLSDEQRTRTVVNLFVNSQDPAEFMAIHDWVTYLFSNRTGSMMIFKCPPGNMPSYMCMRRRLISQAEDPTNPLNNKTIVYFLEDDYLHHRTATEELIGVFRSHNPCFAVPYDYPDRYLMPDHNDDDGHVTIVAGQHRHWRTVTSTTVTFAGRLETVLYMIALDILPHPLNDYDNSVHIASLGASILSPIPGLASHIESYREFTTVYTRPVYEDSSEYVSLYHNWFEEGRNLANFAKYSIEKNIWNLVRMYNERKLDNSLSTEL